MAGPLLATDGSGLTASETVFVGIGANLGDAAQTVLDAGSALIEAAGGGRLSSLYRSAARDDTDQPDFINAVAALPAFIPPEELLGRLLELESEFNRVRDPSRPKGPRTLDLDLLLYGELTLDTPRLSLPHPRMRERKFVLVPLLELAPGLHDPVSGGRFAEIAAALEPQGIYYMTLKDYSECLSWEG